MLALSLGFAAIIILITILEMSLPNLWRPDNLFSVTIAPDSRQHPEVRALITGWRLGNGVIGLIAAGACAATFLLPQVYSLFALPGFLLAYVIVVMALYIMFHRRALAFALPANGSTTRASSLRPRPYGTLIPYWWEVLPLAVIALTVFLLAMSYPNAPAIIPIHFDANGHANGFATKSIWSFFGLVWVQSGLWIMLTLLGVSLSVSRVAASTGAAGESYRQMWARLVFAIKTGILIFLSITAILITGSYQSDATAGPITVLAITFDAAIILLTLALFLRYGQSGWRQSRRTGAQMTARGDATPDSAWKGGIIYFNPDDPAIFVERRDGFGFTVNFGRPEGWLALLGILAPVIIVVVILALATHR
jgi:uncharacterized membrane protein